MNEKTLLKRFVAYYKPHKKMFMLDLLASFFMAALSVLYPIVTRAIFNTYVPNKDIAMICIAGAILLGAYLIRFGLKYFIDYYGHGIGVRMQATMRQDLFNKLEDLPYTFFDNNETGQIMSRMTNDLQNVSELAHHGPENIFITTVTILGAFIYLMTINWILALMILACAPILFIVSLLTRRKQLEAFSQTKKDMGMINASIESSITGIRVTKAFNNKEKELAKFNVNNETYVKSRMKAYKAMSIFHASTIFTIEFFNVVCLIGGGLLTVLTNVFSLSDYLAFAVSTSLFITPLKTLVDFVEQYQDGVTGFKRFTDIMDMEVEIDTGEITNIHLNGDISFSHVYFNYLNNQEVLDDISFEVKQGETIAFVGESGGGKTTICHLLPRFYEISEGAITIDGFNTKNINLGTLRENIGLVQQDVFLFAGTIKDNILYGKLNASDEEVIEAAKKANIYDYINSLPNKFETDIGERGVRLSGGQKQRIAIARIFLKNPSILILDEATSALDNITENQIQKSLTALAKGRTSFIVAHRLSTIKHATRIFVINEGKIVESGAHDDLLEKKGAYYKLYIEQFMASAFNE